MNNHWLLKSEPEAYSIADLKHDKKTCWDGVRNYQARNTMRDDMKVGDHVLFYHSGNKQGGPGVAGLARVCKAAYPDHTALDKNSKYHDPKASKENPVWMMVDIEFVEEFDQILPLKKLREEKKLAEMALLQRGQRLSVQPVTKSQYQHVIAMAR